jgi:di/tricarboxylate transporter
MIVMVSTTQLFKTKAYLTCAIIGAIVGVVIRSIADVYSIYGTEFLFILGMRENYPSKSVSGGWFGAIIFGVILGGILGKVYRSDATMLSNNSFNPTPR